MSLLDLFSLRGKSVLVTGGKGLMGSMICETVRELDGIAIPIDIKDGYDLTRVDAVNLLASEIGPVDILVNNAIGNQRPVSRHVAGWRDDFNVGINAAINMIDAFRASLSVILNIGSDLSLIAPDQSLYPAGMVKPMSYSVVKHGIIGLTRYCAVTFPDIRCNCLCPGGIDQGQKVPSNPMHRLATLEEMKGPVAFMLSPASSYMTGAVVVVDGGRSCL
jgi:NAD(P)-dependent dehydrogenase (short-subunit alcohol dehydrogenase family)